MSNGLSAQDLLPPEIGLILLGFEKSEQGWLVLRQEKKRGDGPNHCRTRDRPYSSPIS